MLIQISYYTTSIHPMDLPKKHRYTTWATDTLFFIPFNAHQCIADIGCICLVNEHIRGTEESWFTNQSITDLRLNLNDPNTFFKTKVPLWPWSFGLVSLQPFTFQNFHFGPSCFISFSYWPYHPFPLVIFFFFFFK